MVTSTFKSALYYVLLPLVALLGNASWCNAQLMVPGPLVLNGTDPNERQVTGLADPLTGDAAISVDAIRTNRTTYTTVNGTSLFNGTLVPAPVNYSAGMLVTIVPTTANYSNAQLELNGLGPQVIVKAGGLPLDSADLEAGVPARLIHDGARFVVLTSTTLPCKMGFHVGSREFCIEDSSRSELTFLAAMTACKNIGARLCKNSEWVHSCLKDPGFIGTVLNYEWVDDAANNVNGAKRVGNGGNGETGTIPGIDCKHGYWAVPTDSVRSRCCMNR